jgi:hypothetical protein
LVKLCAETPRCGGEETGGDVVENGEDNEEAWRASAEGDAMVRQTMVRNNITK